ncbi:MAG: hypothetical protein ACJ8FY_07375 [Gemmataceae bacterium]
MTVKESLEQLLEFLPEEDQRELLDFAQYLRWRQEKEQDDKAAQDAVQFSLPNVKLKSLAAKHKPPQTWFDEEDKPF